MNETTHCFICFSRYDAIDHKPLLICCCQKTVCFHCIILMHNNYNFSCPFCKTSNYTLNLNQAIISANLDHQKIQRLCTEHASQIMMVCEDCKQELCLKCLKEHRAHGKITDLNDYMAIHRPQIIAWEAHMKRGEIKHFQYLKLKGNRKNILIAQIKLKFEKLLEHIKNEEKQAMEQLEKNFEHSDIKNFFSLESDSEGSIPKFFEEGSIIYKQQEEFDKLTWLQQNENLTKKVMAWMEDDSLVKFKDCLSKFNFQWKLPSFEELYHVTYEADENSVELEVPRLKKSIKDFMIQVKDDKYLEFEGNCSDNTRDMFLWHIEKFAKTGLNLSIWNAHKIDFMASCISSLKGLYLEFSNENVSSIKEFGNFFQFAIKLESLELRYEKSEINSFLHTLSKHIRCLTKLELLGLYFEDSNFDENIFDSVLVSADCKSSLSF